eukprot:TRINITY_DN2878_c0_g1_i17.p2 TRINITY_DN2878_c0_g1~~TRINITY_DN2878_c0_g1_i17.p2  ORF type:complete len:141 (+),score=11.51 TRINITY_DN2878_c0_g1_i17:244-666(+)
MDDEPKKIIRKLLRLKINSYWQNQISFEWISNRRRFRKLLRLKINSQWQNQIIFEWTTNRRRFLENFIASTAIIPGQIRQFLNGRRTEEDQENYLGSKSTVTGKIRSALNGQPTEEDDEFIRLGGLLRQGIQHLKEKVNI